MSNISLSPQANAAMEPSAPAATTIAITRILRKFTCLPFRHWPDDYEDSDRNGGACQSPGALCFNADSPVVGYIRDKYHVAPKTIYEFGEFRLDPEARILVQGGKIVPLTPKALELLRTL